MKFHFTTPRSSGLVLSGLIAGLNSLRRLGFGAIILVLGFGISASAQAQTGLPSEGVYNDAGMSRDYSAQTDSLLRPCFGALIGMRSQSCHSAYHRRGERYGYSGGSARGSLINCDRDSSREIAWKVARVRSGGVLHFTGHRCRVSLNIAHSLSLVGTGSHQGSTILEAVDGESCLRVAPTAGKVLIQNLILISSRGGQSACVYASGVELTLKNVQVRYEGESAALNSYGGRVNLIDSALVARTRTAAWLGNQVQVFVENTVVASTSDGIRASLSNDSSMQGVTLVQLGDWKGFERGENARGLDLKLQSEDAILNLDDFKISDFADAARLSGGGEALISRMNIEGATHGLASSLNRVRIINNVVKASEIGISIFGGTGFLGNNRIAEVRTAGILAEDEGKVRAVDNSVDADQAGCYKLKWGNIDPAERRCTPWYKGSEFDTPADADQPMFSGFWPNMEVADAPVAKAAKPGAPSGQASGPQPYVPHDKQPTDVVAKK